MATYTRRINGQLREVKCPPSPHAHLEPDIRQLVGEGLKDREIGEHVGLSERQVWHQRRRLGLESAWPQGRPRKVA
jgi:hypothetical protein